MEPTSDNTFATETSTLQQPVARTSYHHKKRTVIIVVVAIVVIVAGVLGWMYWKKHHTSYQDPQHVLTSLAETSQPVQKSTEDRANDMKALETKPRVQTGQVAKPLVTPEARLEMFNSLNNK